MSIPLQERISKALHDRAELPYSRWRAQVATALDVHPNTVRNWMEANSEPEGTALLAMFDHFGAEFEAEIRGRELGAEAKELAELRQKLVDLGNGT